MDVFAHGNRLFPRSVRMLIGLGAAWFARGSYDQAVQRICEASDLNPSDPVPYLFLGKMQVGAIRTFGEDRREVAPFRHASNRTTPRRTITTQSVCGSVRKGAQDTASAAQVESLLEATRSVSIRSSLLPIFSWEYSTPSREIMREPFPTTSKPSRRIRKWRRRTIGWRRPTGRPEKPPKRQAELQIYDRIAEESAQKAERERHEIRQFVYTLRDQPPRNPSVSLDMAHADAFHLCYTF